MSQQVARQVTDYRALLLLTLGFGLVGLDRFMILPMFPVLAQDLSLDFAQIGIITGALAFTWGFSSIFIGNLSDRFGPRKIAVVSLAGFSLLVGISGLAASLASLVALRAVIGLLEGAFAPAAMVSNFESSAPSQVGRNLGIMQTALPLFGLALAPLAITQLLKVMSWHYIFVLLAIPGFIVAALLWRALGHVAAVTPDRRAHAGESTVQRWREAVSFGNVRITLLCICCWISCLIVVSAFLPSYLLGYLHLDLGQMGFVVSAIGFGATLGGLTMPALSDKIGRKPVALIDAAGTVGFLLLLIGTGADTTMLFAMLFGASFFLYNLLGMTLSTMTAESVPEHVRTTAGGLVIGVGELFGAGVVPVIAGFVAQAYGIQSVLWIAVGATVLGGVALLGFRETRQAPVANPAILTPS